MTKHTLIAIDLAKNVFQVCGMTRQQKITFNKQLRRNELMPFMLNHEPVEVAMEACYSSHYCPAWSESREQLSSRLLQAVSACVFPESIPNRSWPPTLKQR